MDWLNMLKADQEAAPDTIRSFPILPPDELSKVSKVTIPEQEDIFAPDYQNDSAPANYGKDKPLYCVDGDCWCVVKSYQNTNTRLVAPVANISLRRHHETTLPEKEKRRMSTVDTCGSQRKI